MIYDYHSLQSSRKSPPSTARKLKTNKSRIWFRKSFLNHNFGEAEIKFPAMPLSVRKKRSIEGIIYRDTPKENVATCTLRGLNQRAASTWLSVKTAKSNSTNIISLFDF